MFAIKSGQTMDKHRITRSRPSRFDLINIHLLILSRDSPPSLSPPPPPSSSGQQNGQTILFGSRPSLFARPFILCLLLGRSHALRKPPLYNAPLPALVCISLTSPPSDSLCASRCRRFCLLTTRGITLSLGDKLFSSSGDAPDVLN